MQLLLTKGANANAKASDGATALMFAAQSGHKDVVESFHSKGHLFIT
ncbi:MAG: ankyrin repeat domain-containing protein [Syntrophobacteraceae bacterium]